MMKHMRVTKDNTENPGNFKNHPFNFLWREKEPVNAEALHNVTYKIEAIAADRIFQNEPDPVPKSDFENIFMPYHQNGTFMIGERFNTSTEPFSSYSKIGTKFVGPFSHSRKIAISPDNIDHNSYPPAFIRNEVAGFGAWARTTAYQDLLMMEYEGVLPRALSDVEMVQTANAVSKALQYTMSNGKSLYSVIPNQNYIDYFRRTIALYLFHEPDKTFLTETKYDNISKEVSLAIVAHYFKRFSYDNNVDIKAMKILMIIAILSGSMGLDMKCSHCAASDITMENTVFFDDNQKNEKRITKVYHWYPL